MGHSKLIYSLEICLPQTGSFRSVYLGPEGVIAAMNVLSFETIEERMLGAIEDGMLLIWA